MNGQDVVDIETITLASGAHRTPDEGMCLMEAVAYVAGEPHSDHPECVCPVLAAFGRTWNDALNDGDRNRLLKPFIGRLIGSRSTPEVAERRAFMAADWLIREATPTWLRAAGLEDEASSLEGLAPLRTVESCREALPTIAQVREAAIAARAAAPAAAWAAALDAAWDAGTAAARNAARAAAPAAVGAAALDASDAAQAAAWAAAAAGVALRPLVERLQASAVDLYHRMIDVRP